MLVSAIHQHESATGMHLSAPSWASLPSPTPHPPSRLSRSTGLGSLCHTENSPAVSFTYGKVCVFMLLSQFVPPSPSHTVSTSLSLCLSLHYCPANKFISIVFLDSIYMCYLVLQPLNGYASLYFSIVMCFLL